VRIFIGLDPRQPVAAQVLAHSIWARASKPVSIIMLRLNQLPLKRVGLTQFTFSRYLVPLLCDFAGTALFMDADMLCLADICELWKLADESPVSVVKNPNLRFEWPSLMFFRNELCKNLTLEFIENGNPQSLAWASKIGEFPAEWNHLVGYDKPRTDAKNVHFTQGIPCFPETKHCEYWQAWQDEIRKANGSVPWADIMGDSIHAKRVLERNANRR